MAKFFHPDQLNSTKPPALQAILVLLYSLITFLIIGPLVGLQLASPFYGGSLEELQNALQNPLLYPELRAPLLILQGTAACLGLILVPVFFLRYSEKISLTRLFYKKTTGNPLWSLVVSLTVIIFMGFNAILIQWNAQLSFPKFMHQLDVWVKQREESVAELTSVMTSFENPGQLLTGLLVIALIPAIGEEILFRGLLQNYFRKTFRNPHAAIWLAAALFSAIHLQFLGFFPRMVLGALFGYLYLWSGNLYFPILAHFINNSFTLLMIYLFQKGYVHFNIQNTGNVSLTMSLVAFALTFVLLYFFRASRIDKPDPVSSKL